MLRRDEMQRDPLAGTRATCTTAMKRGHANLPLHGGRAPRWLFDRMKRLGGAITELMVIEFGAEGFLERVSDPFWFQCLGCVLGFDWHSSGVTTTTCGALKEGIRGREHELGLYIGGGKGGTSRKTPDEIRAFSESAGTDAERLVYASRMSAKVDSSAVQDGFQVYHHVFLFTATGKWSVVQQGMNEDSGWARRYHWLGDDGQDFVCEPHKAVCSNGKAQVLNMVAREAETSREATAEASRLAPEKLLKELQLASPDLPLLDLPKRHYISTEDIHPSRMKQTLVKTYERQPENFEVLLGMPGVGAKTIRALSLVGQLMYGAEPSFRDPARFSFAHGGKDGIPFPVDRKTYDITFDIMEKAVKEARVGDTDRTHALRRLEKFLSQA
jgi:hypothetical protein